MSTMTFKQFLEMPMAINRVGDWQTASADANKLSNKGDTISTGWDRTSIRAFTSDNAINKIVRRYNSISHDFNVYLVQSNSRATRNPYSHYRLSDAQAIYDEYGIDPRQAPIAPNKINVFITTWDQDPPTPWMMAHRMAHALAGLGDDGLYGFNSSLLPRMKEAILRNYKPQDEFDEGPSNFFGDYITPSTIKRYGLTFLTLMKALATPKSFRDGNVNVDNEAYHEMMAQYIMQGGVKLKNPDPSSEIGQIVNEIQNFLNTEFKKAMDRAKEHIIVW